MINIHKLIQIMMEKNSLIKGYREAGMTNLIKNTSTEDAIIK